MKILVIGGGDSREREVSLRSAEAVRSALVKLGYEVGFCDPQDQWQKVPEEARKYDAVLPILHGKGGEDGKVQRLLDEAGVPYLGAGAEASELCFDKARLKELMAQHGMLTPSCQIVTARSFGDSELARAPFVLKPIADGSSVGVMIARKLPYDMVEAQKLLEEHGKMLLEELVEGVEVTVGVLGEEALPCIEIVPPEGGEFDYNNKYNGATAELCPPQNVSAGKQREAQALAEKLHRLAGVRHLSRTDMIVTAEGRIYVLELNTMPGMTDQSLFPKAAQAAGMSWAQLVARLVELATA